jgi:lipopolysaccharide/colanic/teichoic acid biosynthesis glycosyltransferase
LNVAARKFAVAAHTVPLGPLAPSLERARLRVYLYLMLADIALLFGSFYSVGFVYFHGPFRPEALLSVELMLPLYLTIALHNGTYSLESLTSVRTAVFRTVGAALTSACLLMLFAFFAKTNAVFSRVTFVGGMALGLVLMAWLRVAAIRWCRKRWGASPINTLQIEAGGPPLFIPHAYTVDAIERGLEPTLDDPNALDRLSRYFQNMDEVVVNCPLEERPAWAMVLKSAGVHGEVTSGVMREIGAVGIIDRDQTSTLLVSKGPLGVRAKSIKRVFDLVVSLSALLVLAVPLAIVALLIKLEDGGPILFKQRRMGQSNQFFPIYKLRTMRVEKSDADGTRSAGRDDDRVTRVGRFLRRTSIDELPQLFNVVKGDMSIVGPRPHALGSQAGDKLFWQVDHRYWQRHSLKPGITGLAQIRGFRGATETETDLSSRLQADLEYLDGWSVLRDIQIIFATFGVLAHDRAY